MLSNVLCSSNFFNLMPRNLCSLVSMLQIWFRCGGYTDKLKCLQHLDRNRKASFAMFHYKKWFSLNIEFENYHKPLKQTYLFVCLQCPYGDAPFAGEELQNLQGANSLCAWKDFLSLSCCGTGPRFLQLHAKGQARVHVQRTYSNSNPKG